MKCLHLVSESARLIIFTERQHFWGMVGDSMIAMDLIVSNTMLEILQLVKSQ